MKMFINEPREMAAVAGNGPKETLNLPRPMSIVGSTVITTTKNNEKRHFSFKDELDNSGSNVKKGRGAAF
jgi:hypothetical protein